MYVSSFQTFIALRHAIHLPLFVPFDRAPDFMAVVLFTPNPDPEPVVACFRRAKANATSVSSSSTIVWFQWRRTAGISSSFVPPLCTSPSL